MEDPIEEDAHSEDAHSEESGANADGADSQSDAAADAGEEAEHTESDEAADEVDGGDDGEQHGAESAFQHDESASGGATITSCLEINVASLPSLKLGGAEISALRQVLQLFLSSAASPEAAGEALYNALFEADPALQPLFVTPQAVQAMKFMNFIIAAIGDLEEPEKLKDMVETLGFGHLHLDVTIPGVVSFRNAIIDLFVEELGEKMQAVAANAFTSLLNYVGGAIIFVKSNYASRITILSDSWKKANNKTNVQVTASMDAAAEGDTAAAAQRQVNAQTNQKSGRQSRWKLFRGSAQNIARATHEEGSDGNAVGTATSATKDSLNQQTVPKEFPEMFQFNAVVMGFGEKLWLREVLACFDNVVTNISNSARLKEECEIMVLRISKVAKGNVNFNEYKSCMLASLRSLLPGDWSTNHEVAWSWMWANVERLLQGNMGKPPTWEKALGKAFGALDEDARFDIRKNIYARFFSLAAAGQDFFKQSNTYLHIIAQKILNMTLELYQTPVKMVDDISALGLRHVGYAIPTPLISPFVTACVEIFNENVHDAQAMEGFRWSVGLVSKMLVRTITEGSTIVMKAINTNSIRNLKKAISCAPRGERAQWVLMVQVGTQSISPLNWAIESGAMESASFIITDLLTIRADRDNYYYGVEELFGRHPEIIKTLCNLMPELLPVLLDGLVWRCRATENGVRRVNYYVKHLLLHADGTYGSTFKWISRNGDPKIVCHPILAFLGDRLWRGISRRAFAVSKSFSIFALALFLTSQSILQHMDKDETGEAGRFVVAACRLFIYGASMTQLVFFHTREVYKACRTKNTVKLPFLFIPVPQYLTDYTNSCKLVLALALMGMLCLEPILWCLDNQDDILFYEHCADVDDISFYYSVFSMIGMFFYYSLLLDLAVFSTTVSAFSVMCRRMLVEVVLFLMAAACITLAVSSAISALKHGENDFKSIPKGGLTLLRMLFNMYSQERYEDFVEEPVLLAACCAFLVAATIFLPGLLIAQISCAYNLVYDEMVGFARLHRINIINETMTSISVQRWEGFRRRLGLDRNLEFLAGDIGPSGGIQDTEPAGAHPTTVDTIQRFGGSTSATMQWPEADSGEGDGQDRLGRLEALVKKAFQQRSSKRKGGVAQRGSGSKGSGSNAEGSQLQGSEEESSGDD